MAGDKWKKTHSVVAFTLLASNTVDPQEPVEAMDLFVPTKSWRNHC